jgi:hypothetical protein
VVSIGVSSPVLAGNGTYVGLASGRATCSPGRGTAAPGLSALAGRAAGIGRVVAGRISKR